MNKKTIIWSFMFALSLLLASCRTPAPSTAAPTTAAPEAIYTAAAATAGAILTEMAPKTDTPAPPTPTETETPATATSQATAAVTTAATTSQPVAGGADNSAYAAETVPDGTDFAPNATFTKTWEFSNTGTTTWTTGYSLVFVSGAQMGGPASVPLSFNVAPGQVAPVTVNLTAPAEVGNYRGYWRLENANGEAFGVTVWVDIDVVAGATPGAPTATSSGTTAAATATTSGASTISGAKISIDKTSYTGTCPHTFTFATQFTLSQPATVTYQLEADADQEGYTIQLPAPVTTSLPAGTQQISYYLEFTATLTGWARLHITAPQDVTSNTVTYSLTCED